MSFEIETARLIMRPWRQEDLSARCGYATETARASIDFGLRAREEGGAGLERIVGITHPENVASQRVLQKAGLRRVGEARHYETDVLLFAILAAGYRAAPEQK